jgi:hypothetical protein
VLNFTHFDPGIFPLSQNTPLKCANGSCDKPMLFCEAVIFNWHDGKQHHNAGFCTSACALTCMNPATMAKA